MTKSNSSPTNVGGRHNPYLCTMSGWRDTFDVSLVTCHIFGRFSDNFSSLQTQIKKQGTYNTKREEYLDLVKEEFGAFDPYKLDRIWAIMYDNLRSILKNRGGNDYKPEHTGKRKRQKSAGTAVDLTVPMEDYHECVRLVREYRRAHPLE